jgi:hypothetical protein
LDKYEQPQRFNTSKELMEHNEKAHGELAEWISTNATSDLISILCDSKYGLGVINPNTLSTQEKGFALDKAIQALCVPASATPKAPVNENLISSFAKVPFSSIARGLLPIENRNIDPNLCRTSFETSKTSDKEPAKVGTKCNLLATPLVSNTVEARCTVESRPSDRKNLFDECTTCDKSFRWFRRAHSCRSCGVAICDDCSKTSRLPWYGYNHAVRVCNACKTHTIPLRIVRSWLAISKEANSDVCLQIASACSAVYQINLKDDWIAAAQYFIEMAHPTLAAYCYQQANVAMLEVLPQLIDRHQDAVACLFLKSQQLTEAEAFTVINKSCTGLDVARVQELVAYLNLNTSLLHLGDRFLSEHNYELLFACFKTNCSVDNIKAHARRHILSGQYNHALVVYLCWENPAIDDWTDIGLQLSAARMDDARRNECLSMWSSCVDVAFRNKQNIWQRIVENLLARSQDYRFLAWICLTVPAKLPIDNVLQVCAKLLQSEQDVSIAAQLLRSLPDGNALEQTFVTSSVHRLILHIRQMLNTNDKSLGLADLMRILAHSADLQLINYAVRCLPRLKRAETWRQIARITNDEQAKIQYFLMAYHAEPCCEDLVAISSLLKSNKLKAAVLCSALRLPDVDTKSKVTILMNLAIVIGSKNCTLQHAALTLASALLQSSQLPEPYQQQFLQSKEASKRFEAEEQRKLALFLGRPFFDRNWKMFVDNLVHCFQNGEYKNVASFINQIEVRTIETRSMPEKAYLYLAFSVYLAMNDDVHEAVKVIWQAVLMFPDEETMFEPVAAILSGVELRTTFVRQMIDSLKNYRASPPLLFGSLDIPTEHSYQKMLKRTRELVSIAKCETSLKKLANLPEESKAFLYIDFSMAAPDMASTLSCFLLSAICFLKKIEYQDSSLAERYALKQAILVCVAQVQSLTQSLSPSLQIYFLQLSSKLILQVTEALPPVHAAQCTIESGLLCGILRKLVELSRLIPIATPTQLASDLPYVGIVASLVLRKLLNEAACIEASILPPERVQYYMFEGLVSGWLQAPDDSSSDDSDEKNDVEKHKEAVAQARVDCMDEMLMRNNLAWVDVEQVSAWHAVPRTVEGFLLPTKHNLNDMDIHSIDGFKFDNQTGQLEFNITKASSKKPGLISWSDLREVMSKGIPCAVFSLENPDSAYSMHPFQQACYVPHSLQDTDFLATLQHTDYLLKFFSTGTEVSSYAPFEMRNSSHLQERLPSHLKTATTSIPERKGGMSRGTAHRFWIEAEEIPTQEQRTEQFLSITYGKPTMVIKKHLLQLDDAGNLVDADVDSTDESPEAAFARDFTTYYEEIGEYFPEFLRLRELLKLAAMYGHILGLKESQENRISDDVKTKMINGLKENLSLIKTQIGEWPSASSYVARSARYNRVAANNYLYSLNSSQQCQVNDIMRTEDQQVLDTLTTTLANQAGMSESSIRDDVRTFLSGDGSTQLATTIMTAKIQELQKPSTNLNSQLAELGFVKPTTSNKGLHDAPPPCAGNECSWLPAAYNQDINNRYRVYGGVCMIPKTNVQSAPMNTPSGTTVSSSQVPKTRANKHGYTYQKARSAHLRELVNCDKTASHIKGWIRNQIRDRGKGYLKAVPGYETGHKQAAVGGGPNIPSNLRQELKIDNNRRGNKEKKFYNGRRNKNNNNAN